MFMSTIKHFRLSNLKQTSQFGLRIELFLLSLRIDLFRSQFGLRIELFLLGLRIDLFRNLAE